MAACAEGKREFAEQHTIAFDIDGIDLTKIDAYLAPVCSCLGVELNKTGVVSSGNGLHFLVQLDTPILDPLFFESNRHHYQAICEKIRVELVKLNLPGEPDPSVFDARRIMRLPNTENRKENKPVRHSSILQGDMTAVRFDLAVVSGIPTVTAGEQVNAKNLKNLPTPDTTAILEGCEFLKWCEKAPSEVSEAQWYGMLSIVPRLPDGGRDIAHEYSSGHPAYSRAETESKIDQALTASGPRTCENINKLWGKCSTCKYNGKVTSPIMIQGESYIKTQSTGFHDQYINAAGNLVSKPSYEDLRRYFQKLHSYIVLDDSGICLIWKGTHWEEIADLKLKNFAQDHFKPDANNKMVQEFSSLVCRTNIRSSEWFTETTNRCLNFKNGVLNLDTMQLEPHSVTRGFRSVLAYDYDPNATCPIFDAFLDDVMLQRQDLVTTLLEYGGYCFSNDECWAQKALIMTGEGSNGKSTYMDVLKALAGKSNCSTLTLSDLKSETSRKMLDGKLFNLAEETPTYAMSESSIFKNLVSGGETTVKTLYKQPYSIANKAKLLFACNELPKTKDTTRGYFRRLLIVPFDNKYEKHNKDSFIKKKLLTELPGIFNRIIAAYKTLLDRQGFLESSTLDAELNEYRTDLDTVKAWYEECVDHSLKCDDETHIASIHNLYASYRGHAETAGEKPETRATVARRLKYLMPEWKHRKFRSSKLEDRKIHFRGIRFNDHSKF